MTASPVIDFINTSDWVFPDFHGATERLVEILPALSATGEMSLEEHGLDTSFIKAEAPMRAAPTRIQLVTLSALSRAELEAAVEARGDSCTIPPLSGIVDDQGARQKKFHGTTFMVDDFEQAVAWLREKNVPIFFEPPCAHLPFGRCWIGWSESGDQHVPGYDAGVYAEFISSQTHGNSVREAAKAGGPATTERTSRLARRTFLVDDLNEAAAQLEGFVGVHDGASFDDAFIGARTISYSFRHPGSLEIAIAEPHSGGFARQYYERWGPGMITTSIYFDDPAEVVGHAASVGATILLDGSPRTLLADDGLPGLVVEVLPLP